MPSRAGCESGAVEYAEWIEAWYESHETPMHRATQPAHRCLSHLILLMARTIENISTDKDERDLRVSKKEMKLFGKAHNPGH